MKISNDYENFRKMVDLSLSDRYDKGSDDISYVKRALLTEQPIVFYNKCKMYFDKSSLPPTCTDVTDLSGKCVVYGIYCNGKFYIGSTTDFGERMTTHIRDSRKNKKGQQLYSDMVKKGECLSFVFRIADNVKIMKEIEHLIISRCKEYSIEKACDFNKDMVRFINESFEDSREYEQKYCYNIID